MDSFFATKNHKIVALAKPADLVAARSGLGRKVTEICSDNVTAAYAKAAFKETGAVAGKLVAAKGNQDALGLFVVSPFTTDNYKEQDPATGKKVDNADIVDNVARFGKKATGAELAVLCVHESVRGKQFGYALLARAFEEFPNVDYFVVNQAGNFADKHGVLDAAATIYHALFDTAFATSVGKNPTTMYVASRDSVLAKLSKKLGLTVSEPQPPSGAKPKKAARSSAKVAKAAAEKPRRSARKATKAPGPHAFKGSLAKSFKAIDVSVSGDAVRVFESMTDSLLGDLTTAAAQAMHGRQTLTLRDVDVAAKLVLSKAAYDAHSVDAKQAVATFEASYGKNGKQRETASQRAKLEFSVPRVTSYLRSRVLFPRISRQAPVYLAALVQRVVQDMADCSQQVTVAAKRKRVSPHDVTLCLAADSDLKKSMRGTVGRGGVAPHIETALLPPVKKVKKTK